MAAGFLRTEDLPGPQMFDNLSVACSQESPTEGWNRKLGPREGQRSGAGNRFGQDRYRTLNGYSEMYLLAAASLWKPGRLPHPIWLECLHKDDEESPLSRMGLIWI